MYNYYLKFLLKFLRYMKSNLASALTFIDILCARANWRVQQPFHMFARMIYDNLKKKHSGKGSTETKYSRPCDLSFLSSRNKELYRKNWSQS